MAIARAQVLYNYFPSDDTQIPLEAGQVLSVYYKDDSGWWDGMNEDTGERGLFPSTYVEEIFDYQPATGKAAQEFDSNYTAVEFEAKSAPGAARAEPLLAGGKKPAELEYSNDPFKKTTTRYGMWANNMSMYTGFGMFLAGVGGLTTSLVGLDVLFHESILLIVAIGYGFIVSIYELRAKTVTPTSSMVSFVFYLLTPFPFYATYFTLFPAILLNMSAFVHLKSWTLKEAIKIPTSKKGHKKENICVRLANYIPNVRRQNRAGLETFKFLWIAVNIYVCADTLRWWYGEIDRRRIGASTVPLGNEFPFTYYLPWARAFGTGLNLTCTVIMLPVSRTFIRGLYDYSTQNQSCSSRTLRSILWLFPLDRALHFHIKTGWLILFYAFGHTFAHMINAGLVWDQVLDFYGWSPLLSGFFLWILMFFLYPGVLPSVKHGHFELFWYGHQIFFGFFALCLIHGRGSFGPNYWKWFIVPGTIYIFERIYREYAAYQTVPLISVTNMDGTVLSIEFSKTAMPNGYLEGQYVFLNAPWISKGQWHPFTISSAPQEETVTIHIRVQGEKSWTRQLRDYLTLFGPDGASYFELADQTDKGVFLGKKFGPSGEKILRLYGPHAAPTQHVPEYPVDMIVGSGIGVTPVCSTIQSIVYHRWKFNIGTSYPDHAYFVWVCSHRDIDYFRWMIRIVKECQDEIYNMRSKNDALAGKTFEVHVYVTSAPDNAVAEVPVVDDDILFWGKPRKEDRNVAKTEGPFTEVDLYMTMKAPPKEDVHMGDVIIHNGRPDWDTIFTTVSDRHIANPIGVAFCGNPRIGKDLKRMCKNHTNVERRTFFTLHKENF
jgi:NADPH oxidase